MKTLGSALIGTGDIARTLHMNGHRGCTDSRLIYVCDIRAASAKEFSKRFGIPKWTTDLSEVLRDPEVDWVDIATPNDTHADIAVQALAAGKHVLCQKPMAGDAAEARRMTEAAARAGKKLGIFMCFRGDGAYDLLKRLIDERRIGELISLRGKMISGNGRKMDPNGWRSRGAAGALEQLGTHLIDLFLGLAGPIRWVSAYSATIRSRMAGDDVTTAVYGLPDGVTAVMETTYCSYTGPSTPKYILEANGTDGYFRYRMETGELELQMGHDDIVEGRPYQAGQILRLVLPSFVRTSGIHRQFVHGILHDEEPLVTGAAGLDTMQVLEATRQAAREGGRVPVQPA